MRPLDNLQVLSVKKLDEDTYLLDYESTSEQWLSTCSGCLWVWLVLGGLSLFAGNILAILFVPLFYLVVRAFSSYAKRFSDAFVLDFEQERLYWLRQNGDKRKVKPVMTLDEAQYVTVEVTRKMRARSSGPANVGESGGYTLETAFRPVIVCKDGRQVHTVDFRFNAESAVKLGKALAQSLDVPFDSAADRTHLLTAHQDGLAGVSPMIWFALLAALLVAAFSATLVH